MHGRVGHLLIFTLVQAQIAWGFQGAPPPPHIGKSLRLWLHGVFNPQLPYSVVMSLKASPSQRWGCGPLLRWNQGLHFVHHSWGLLDGLNAVVPLLPTATPPPPTPPPQPARGLGRVALLLGEKELASSVYLHLLGNWELLENRQ